MQQINEDTGTARPVQRKLNSFGVPQPTGMKVIVLFIRLSQSMVKTVTDQDFIANKLSQ